MQYKKQIWEDLGVEAELSIFQPDMNGQQDSEACTEIHLILHIEPRGECFDAQLSRLEQAEQRLMQSPEMEGMQAVFRRYFLSDATNQVPVILAHRHDGKSAASYIQQPPLDGSKVALWVYCQRGAGQTQELGMTVIEHNGYRHLYHWGLIEPEGDSYHQTRTLLERYEDELQHFGATLADNCVRTWFCVRDVDIQYAGMVRARRENFAGQGLTRHSHYIASTGIGGVPADTGAIVQFDTYAITGFKPEQRRHLYARTHLNPTYEYGVTFERGTVMEYGDRAEVLISGTASINNCGKVVHSGDIVGQTHRMWENVEKLLEEADATAADLSHIIVYLRDLADYQTVKHMFDERYPDVPRVFTLAPVCRPTWLIEMECMATPHRKNRQYRNF